MKSFALALGFSCLILAVRPSWEMEESPSSAPLQSSPGNTVDLDPELDPESLMGLEMQGSPGKRAYTYVSEYKRLPIYNFGLGKRWGGVNSADEEKRARLYSFGLGKRARPYSFGLGKRGGESSPSSYIARGDDYEELSRLPVEDYLEKRSRLYSFGLGKRMAGEERGDFGVQRFNFGLGKRPSEDFGHRYKFGLGKRRLVNDEDDQQLQNVAS